MRAQISPQISLLSWLQRLQTEQFETRYYEYTSLADIQAQTDLPQEIPLFNGILVFENYPSEEDTSSDNVLRQHAFGYREETNYPLTIDIMPDDQLKIKALYKREHFTDDAIERIFTHFKHLLIAAPENAEKELINLSILDVHDYKKIVHDWNRTDGQSDERAAPCLHHLFEEQVQRTPEQVAVLMGSYQVTYQELDRRANQLAHLLCQLGVGPDSVVGVCMERSITLVVSLLAIRPRD